MRGFLLSIDVIGRALAERRILSIAMSESTPMTNPVPISRRFVLGITGASGALYAIRLLEQLLARGHEVHLVVSEYGRRLLLDETGIKNLTLQEMLPHLASASRGQPAPHDRGALREFTLPPGLAPSSPPLGDCFARLFVHPHKDVGAVIASGSFLHDGMVVLPCSSTTLGALASGSGSNLLCRAAMVTLKERRPLIVCHRETPLNLIDIEAYRTLTLAGAIVCPTNPGFYLLPRSVAEIVDFIVGKALDLLRVEHDLKTRWEKHVASPELAQD
jgi:4-hydroxy-3-polyprenylbenzoate decarboxylase